MFPDRKKVRFPGAFGDQIAARLDLPNQSPRAYALFSHCFTCGKDLKAANWITRELVDRRIAVLRFDFTGIGESEGEFAETNFSTNVADLIAAADFLRQQYAPPKLLIGHSLGGSAAIVAASRIPECAAVAAIAAPSNTTHLREILESKAPELEQKGEAHVDVMGNRVRIKRQMLEDLARQNLRSAIADLKRPLLIFHSPVDQVVHINHAARIFDAAQHPKSFVSLDDADHLLVAREADARYVAEVLAAWAGRYLEPADP